MSTTAAPPSTEDGSEPPLASSVSERPAFLSAPSATSALPIPSSELGEFDSHSTHAGGPSSPGLSSGSTPQFSPYSTVSIPPTPAGHDDDRDPLPEFNAINLELSQRDHTSLHHPAQHGSGSEARNLTRHLDDNHERLATAILARTSAGQQATKVAVPSSSSSASSTSNSAIPIPGPAGTTSSSTVVTPGDSRSPTPAPPNSRPTAPTTQSSYLSTLNAPVVQKKNSETGLSPPPIKEKKSVFGKLFDRDKNSSNVSIVSSALGSSTTNLHGGNGSQAMERGGGGSGSGSTGGQFASTGGEGTSSTGEGASLMRRKSANETKEREKREKEQKEREKKERKEREKREKEELKERERAQKHERERERSLSRGRTPSQNGRSRNGGGDAAGAGAAGNHSTATEPHHEKTGLGGAMDFMRIKVQRKTSVTSRKSDDGKSEHGDEGRSQYGGSETKSRGGQSNASLSKKYGVCDKVIVGKGATAVVRLAHKWDRSTERLYAVKEFRKRRKNETEKEYVKKLTSEFCISSTLHHHNVVETVDLVQDEQQHWCEVMEYCPGGDLYAAIKKGDLEPAEINSYFKQIIAGISYLHSMGVAHRDIKPENLLIDAKGHVKITDFGVSDVFRMCWEKKTHLSKGLCGSEPYIAPEQFEHKEYDARLVDVWAAAVVFYCMHFQELPWRVAKQSDPSFGPYVQLYSTSSSTPPPLSNLVPRECRSIIRRMLDPDPKTRATTETILNDPWFSKIEVIPPLEGILPPVPNLP
ncbi:uncharacterized protein JCM15063_004536 [Sporobolomyces koalae]|uniref:uncharacterized protein n=1 Tax=Sporobolomyces koalae TaxID=500713 RepID=UPI003182219B